jgi:hypothetical protein
MLKVDFRKLIARGSAFQARSRTKWALGLLVAMGAMGLFARAASADAPCGMPDDIEVDFRTVGVDEGAPFTLTYIAQDDMWESGACDWGGHTVYVFLFAIPDSTLVTTFPVDGYQISVQWNIDLYIDSSLTDNWTETEDDYAVHYGDDNYADTGDAVDFTWDDTGTTVPDQDFSGGGSHILYWGTVTPIGAPSTF